MYSDKYYIFLVFVFVKVANGLIAGSIQTHCRQSSKCVSLKECTPFMNLIGTLQKPLRPSVVEFLRAQQCGFSEGYPKVCCSLLPKSLRVLKHARHQEKNSPVKQLAASEEDIFRSTTAKTTTTTTVRVDLKAKSEAINRAFVMDGFFDLGGSFDLFRRKRGSQNNNLDVEIR